MTRVRFLHIGDVHYPEALAERLADVKDLAFPSRIAEATTLKPLEIIMRELLAEVERGCDAILLSGDLTNFGSLDGYEKCVEYLRPAIGWIGPDRIHAVPGNHDVDRSAVAGAGADLFAKFRPFRLIWEAVGLPVLAVDDVRIKDLISPTGGLARVLSINSSFGCGEKRFLPDSIGDELEALISKFASGSTPKDAFKLFGETLDTPAFQHKDIEEACKAIEETHDNVIPVVLSHHNLLPQALPRIALYTEILNGGVARSRFLSTSRPLLYFHGHIHDDPIEVVADPVNRGSSVILISAPTLNRGFNSVTVEFGRKGFPLGCIITTYKFNERDGNVHPRVVRIPFHGPNLNDLKLFGNEHVLQIIGSLPETEVRFRELQKDLNNGFGHRLQRNTLAQALLEAEWLGCIALRNDTYPPEHWYVRRTVFK